MNKKNIIITLVTVIVTSLVIYFIINDRTKLYSNDYTYMNTYINVKIYAKKNPQKIFDEIDKIYNEYHELSDRYNAYDNVNNIYYINHNTNDEEYITIDSKLYDLIKYGVEKYNYTNGLININLGNVIDVWKKYRDNNSGVPSMEELKASGSIDINDIKLIDGNKILNNHPNIDLGAIAKGYVTKIVAEYIESKGYKDYLINAGGHIVVGEKYKANNYVIAIRKPDESIEGNVILNVKNTTISTSGGYERYYEYDGKQYNHIINPNTLFPAEYMKSVTVVTDDSALADVLTTTLFLMPVDEGVNYVNNLDGVEAIWYTNDNQIVRSNGFSNYE